jgi:hypothetical protein
MIDRRNFIRHSGAAIAALGAGIDEADVGKIVDYLTQTY